MSRRLASLVAAFGLLGTAVAVAHAHGVGLWVVALATLGPDLAFVAAIGAPHERGGPMPARVVPLYNLAHHPAGALALGATALVARSPLAAAVAVAWLSHLAWDRSLGYRLRRPDGTIRA